MLYIFEGDYTITFFPSVFENNRGAEKVEVNYERLKNPKKMFRPQERTGLIRVRFDSLLTDTHDQLKI
jgi:hypothetical protein